MLITDLKNHFFQKEQWTKENCQQILTNTLRDFDDGELYLQEAYAEAITFDDQRVSNSSFNISKGFGLRAVLGEVSSYAHTTELSEASLRKASEVVRSIKNFAKPVHIALPHSSNNNHLYKAIDPISEIEFQAKISLAQEIDSYIRDTNAFVRQVSIRIIGAWSAISILKTYNEEFHDIRPSTQLVISVTLSKDGKLESASESIGTRNSYSTIFPKENWQRMANNALEKAMIKLTAEQAPAGEFTVVLGAGDPGILLHEAVGHGLEGDFNRKKTSAFSGLMGKQVAAKGVTVIDDGTIPYSRGSLNFDDEGTPTSRNILIEDGILVGYMQDRMNARLMNMKPTGNGRRENYSHQPMPRMTNTFMLPGTSTQEEMVASINKGIYFPKFNSGQVDITSGKFVFEAGLAYLIEKGKITKPIKGASLIGTGAEVMTKIRNIGNNLAMDTGTGMCGKNGQTLPVGLGQPSLLIEKITVGGTKL